jgi:type I restriction enzyme S subunit
MIVNEREADARYLFYALKQTRGALLRVVVGGAQRNLSGKLVREHRIPVPPLAEQRAIAGLLGALDDKIDQNRRISAALERLARAMFRAWFVDFEPIKAKAAGATYFPSMPQAVFDALPTRFVHSEFGPVPEGWEVKPVSEAFEVNPSRRLAKGQAAPYLDMKNMPTQGHAPESWEYRAAGSGMRFINGDTLVARITPCLENGKTAFVDFLDNGEVAWGSTEYIVLRPKPPLPEIFAYCLARTAEFRDFAVQNMSGTSGRQRVAATAMDHFRIAVPAPIVAAEFGELAGSMFQYVRAAMNESRKLAQLRDYLLPKLLSGEVRVREAERAVAEAV